MNVYVFNVIISVKVLIPGRPENNSSILVGHHLLPLLSWNDQGILGLIGPILTSEPLADVQ